MKNKYDFYEVVEVRTALEQLSEINGKEAVIIGMARNNDGIYSYAIEVFINEYDTLNTLPWNVSEDVLQPTGKFMKREDFYDGSTAKVVVDDKGRGHLKELHLKEPTDKDSDV